MNKISDFKFAESLLKEICRIKNINFIDVGINFDNKDHSSNTLSIGKPENVCHTIYKIVDSYIDNILSECNAFVNQEEKEEFLIRFASVLRGLIYKDKKIHYSIDEPTIQHLYQNALIWILMKDLICPIYNIPLNNIKIISGKTPYSDICKYYNKEKIQDNSDVHEDFIFVNEIDNQVVQDAFLFIETLKAQDLNPLEVVKYIYESNLYDKFIGLLTLAYENENNIVEFEFVLTNILGIDFDSFTPDFTATGSFNIDKFAQKSSDNMASPWWFLGLTEKMLDNSRETNWSVHEALEPYIEEFWDTVEKVKKERGKKGKDEGVPFNTLLRIKSKQTSDSDIDDTITLQGLLSSNRVW